MKYLAFFSLVIIGFLTIPSANAQQELYRTNSVNIVTTTGHIADLVREIVGDKAKVTSMMSTGTDPHLFRPTRSDLLMLKQADIIFYNGLHLEAQIVDVLKKLSKDKPVVAIADSVETRDLIHQEEKAYDPHIWMNVNIWRHAIPIVIDTVSEFLPNYKQSFVKAGEAYSEKLDSLDYRVQVAIATIPKHRRVLITAHDAFGYLGRAYDIQVIGIQGLSTESEAGIQHIENLIDLIIEHDIRAIFAETSVDSRNIEAIVEGAKVRGHDVIIGGKLYSDSLGPEGSDEDNYIGMMVHNVTTIAEALGGDSSSLKEYRMEYLRTK